MGLRGGGEGARKRKEGATFCLNVGENRFISPTTAHHIRVSPSLWVSCSTDRSHRQKLLPVCRQAVRGRGEQQQLRAWSAARGIRIRVIVV